MHINTNASGGSESTVWLGGDFSGGGKADVAAGWNNSAQLSVAVFPSDGSKFPGWTQWSDRDGGWIDNAKFAAGDFNGDGKTDIAAIWNNGGDRNSAV